MTRRGQRRGGAGALRTTQVLRFEVLEFSFCPATFLEAMLLSDKHTEFELVVKLFLSWLCWGGQGNSLLAQVVATRPGF